MRLVREGGGGGTVTNFYCKTYLFKSNKDFIGFNNKSVNFRISSIPEFSKSAS